MRFYPVLLILLSGLVLISCSTEGGANEDGIETEESHNSSGEDQNSAGESEDAPDADIKLIWKTYHNQRFDFCVDYPSNFLNPTGESENHDGNTFANANGSSEMRASGIYNALDETIAEAFERATENDKYYDDEKKITYKLQKDNWFVASGTYYESIFYVKSILVEDTFYTLYFEYHSSESGQYDEIIKRTTKDFPGC
jgi:hypothetical protein